MPKFSANLGFLWPDRPLLDRVEAAADAGFRAVEFHWPFDVPAAALREACGRRGLVLLGLNTWPGDVSKGDFGLGADEGREADFETAIDQAIDYARAAGMGAIHVMAGVAPADRHAQARDVFVANLRMAARKAPELTLLLEPINPRDKPGYFYSSIEEAASIIDDVGVPNLRIMFDIYHVGVSQGDVLKRLERFLPKIGHVQIAAVPSRAEPDEGEIAYGFVLREIDRLGYAGWVGCEYKPRAGTDEGLAWVRTLGVSL